MLHSTLSRYHIMLLVTAALAVGAIVCSQWLLLALAVIPLLAAIGLGSVYPRLSFFGPFICRGKISRRQVALTFDDGPDVRSTPALLDLLRATGVPAAFFCIGKRVAAEPALAARMVREGHLCENHTYTHDNLTNVFTVKRLRSEMDRTQRAIQQATGVVPRCFRPPMGLSNPRLFRAARAVGLNMVGWSVRGLDTKLREPERIVKRITRGLQPGAIILLHDGNIPPERLLPTVKTLLDTLHALGYEIVRLDQLLG